jgi:endonuclease G
MKNRVFRIIPMMILFVLGTTSLLGQENQYLPQASFDGQLINHGNYYLYYVEEHEQAAWVAYELTTSDAFSNMKRTDDFREDSQITTGSAGLSDYRGSGYDRGHQIPAGDAKGSRRDMSETFYTSNMTPQSPTFNRSVMRDMEMMIRGFASDEKLLYVVTGPVFQNNLGSIGANKITIPGAYYKVILDLTPPMKMIAFLLPHKEDLSKDFTKSVTSVDRIENLTGIDFFSQLEDTLEDRLEASTEYSGWDISGKTSKSYSHSSTSDNKGNKTTYSQCSGIAKSTSQRCKIKVDKDGGYCRYHKDQKD